MTDRLRPARRPALIPDPLRWSITAWLAAVAFGAAEAVVRLALPDPPTVGELATRAGIYAVVAASVLALASGRPAVRVAVAVMVGGIGTLSLIAEPAAWWAVGGSPGTFLAAADGATLLIVGLRAAHLLAVVVAMAAMFHPRVNAFFRSPARAT
jgi:hypothetical protein